MVEAAVEYFYTGDYTIPESWTDSELALNVQLCSFADFLCSDRLVETATWKVKQIVVN